MDNNHQKDILRVISLFLLFQFAYSLYIMGNSIMLTFDPSKIVGYVFDFMLPVLLLLSTVGLFLNKKWAIITYWIYIILFFLFPLLGIRTLSHLYNSNIFFGINILVAILLSVFYWKRMGKDTVYITSSKKF
jgi:hypothetical protein